MQSVVGRVEYIFSISLIAILMLWVGIVIRMRIDNSGISVSIIILVNIIVNSFRGKYPLPDVLYDN